MTPTLLSIGAWPLTYVNIEWQHRPEKCDDDTIDEKIKGYEELQWARIISSAGSAMIAVVQVVIAIAAKSIRPLHIAFFVGACLSAITFVVSSCLAISASYEISKLQAQQDLIRKPSDPA